MTISTTTYPKLAGHDDEENAIWMFDEDEELPKEEAMKMPFGKHKGEPVSDIPRSYFRWLLEQDFIYDDKLKDLLSEIEDECATRDRSYDKF